jgi:putative salt-induced outer membrane protein
VTRPARTVPAARITAAIAALAAVPAQAELPEPVRAMIDAAIATGDEGKVAVVLEIARATNPSDIAEIDAVASTFKADVAARKAAEEDARKAALAKADPFDNWSGKGELGGFRATGNSSNTGITAGLTLERQGLDWRHRLTGRVDYQRAGGITTREQFLGRYEPNVNVSDDFYIYALAQYERDRFQGFSGRYAISGGMGYQAIKADDLQLSIKAGPAYRVTEFVDGRNESRVAGLVAFDFDWTITDRLKLTQDTNAVAETGASALALIDSRNTSIDLVTGLDATIYRSLKARLSYTVEYDSNPPPGAVQTDTLSRVTLIYDF